MGPGMMGTRTYGHSTYSSVISMLVTISATPSYNISSTSAFPSTSSFGRVVAEDPSAIILSAPAGATTTVSTPIRTSTSASSATATTTGLVLDTIPSPAPTDGTADIISPATAPPETPLPSTPAPGHHANTTQARLSTAETAGVAVGGIAGLAFIGFAVTFLFMRRREKRRRAREMTTGFGEEERYSAKKLSLFGAGRFYPSF